MKPSLPAFLMGISVLVATGLIHGLWTDRWGWAAEPETSASRLAGVPQVVGDWSMVQETSLEDRDQENSGIVGYVIRRYVHRQTHQEVQLFLVCGRPGHISVHTPDVCFEGAGYKFIDEPRRQAIVGQDGNDFWTSDCTKATSVLPEKYRIYWSWNAGGQWQAAENPRLSFARHKALFKLYVIEKLPPTGVGPESDPAQDFLGQMLPEVKKCLFPQ